MLRWYLYFTKNIIWNCSLEPRHIEIVWSMRWIHFQPLCLPQGKWGCCNAARTGDDQYFHSYLRLPAVPHHFLSHFAHCYHCCLKYVRFGKPYLDALAKRKAIWEGPLKEKWNGPRKGGKSLKGASYSLLLCVIEHLLRWLRHKLSHRILQQQEGDKSHFNTPLCFSKHSIGFRTIKKNENHKLYSLGKGESWTLLFNFLTLNIFCYDIITVSYFLGINSKDFQIL
jgi:hypothetical protein